MNNEIDLGAFPILRLDQIIHIDSTTLESAQDEARLLIQEMENSATTPPKLVFYLKRQIESVSKELSLRAADDRIKKIITGHKGDQSTPSKVSTVPPVLSPKAVAASDLESKTTSVHDVSLQIKQSNDRTMFMTIPLPSELRANRISVESRDIESTVPRKPEVIDSSQYALSNTKSFRRTTRDEGASQLDALTSSSDPKVTRKQEIKKDVPSRRRPSSGSNFEQTPKKSIDIVYENFGSQFVVAATEKRLRFFPKKKADIDPEELKVNDRNERRKAAMKRLTERQDEREARKQKLRVQRRTTKQEIMSANIKKIDIVDTDSSESVSGGEFDGGVAVDPKAIQGMQEYLQQAPTEIPAIPANAECSHELALDKSDKPATIYPSSIDEKPVVQSNPSPTALENASNSSIKAHSKTKETISRTGKKATATPNRPITHNQPVTKRNTHQRKIAPVKDIRSNISAVSEVHDQCGQLDLDRVEQIATADSIQHNSEDVLDNCDNLDKVTEDRSTSKESSYEPVLEFPADIIPLSEDVVAKNKSALDAFRNLKRRKARAVEDEDKKVILERSSPSDVGTSELGTTITEPGTDVIVETNIDTSTMEHTSEPDSEPSGVSVDSIPDSGRGRYIDFDIVPSITTEIEGMLMQPTSFSSSTNSDSVHAYLEETPNADIFKIRSSQLFRFLEDGSYSSHVGPDELPGLRAWSLSPIDDIHLKYSAKWIVSIEDYWKGACTDSQVQELAKRRIAQRRRVSYGVLAMAVELEGLLVGIVDCKSEEQFLSHWNFGLEYFDCKLSKLSSRLTEQVFDEVSVCGNCYSICRKIENLVKAGFQAQPYRFNERLLQNSRIAIETEDLIDQADSFDHSHNSAPVDEPVSVDAASPRAQSTEPYLGASSRPNIDAIGNDDNSGDEEEFMVPSYQFAVLENSRVRAGVQEDLVGSTQPNRDFVPQIVSPATRISSSVTMSRLSDVYPSIGSIFPVAYNENGPKNSEVTARALVECMQLQGNLYDEWMEIMSDYATVFSQDRGLEKEVAYSNSAAVYGGGTKALHYRVKSSRPEVYNIVTDVFRNILTNWEELPAGLGLGVSWNLLWTWSKPRINMSHLLVWQRVNHFNDSKQLTRKDLLKKNLQRYTSLPGAGSDAFEIMPQTFLLPHEYNQFVKAFNDAEVSRGRDCSQNFWIMKPVGLSRGRGISLVRDISSLVYSQTSVIQRYVEKPLCLAGYKFDLRLYVLVTSFRPLEAFIYREGFARLSTQAYSLDPADMANKFIHLTNSSIQKQNVDGPSNDNPLSQIGTAENSDSASVGGSKMALLGPLGLWARLQSFGLNTETIWQSICLLVTKSLVVVDDKIAHQPCCFEVFGYDVLLDSDLRPWLLEVNASPSLARENALDIRVKNAMIKDTIVLLDPISYDRAALARVLRRRLSDVERQKATQKKGDAQWEQDLRDILGDSIPRKYGDMPRICGEYERLCPGTKHYAHTLKLKSRIIRPTNDK